MTPSRDRIPAALALASIPTAVVNMLGDARVSRLTIGRGGAWLGTFEVNFAPPARIEDAIELASGYAGVGLRAIELRLTNGAALWLGSRFRFAFLEDAADVASRDHAVDVEGPTPPAPYVRPKR